MRFEVPCMLVGILLAHCDLLSGNTPDNNPGLTVPLQAVEGDILLNPMQLLDYQSETKLDDAAREARAVTMTEIRKWPGGIVPYIISPEFSSSAHAVIMTAINQFMMDTCVKFKKKEPADFDHLYFYPGTACLSFVGRQEGQQNVSIGPMCEHKGVVMHEIFHALGRWHEHSRGDRDDYVQVNMDNILTEQVRSFRIVSNANTQGIAYDYDSIMHYDAYAFSNNNLPTIQPRDESVPLARIGQRNTFSAQDIRHVQELYCNGVPVGVWSTWDAWSSCSTTCGPGIRQRTRTCFGGSDCFGEALSTNTCNLGDCPPVSVWGAWTTWSPCSRTCGSGQRTRVRQCMSEGNCEGENQEFQTCSLKRCTGVWGPWGEWEACSSTCEGGVSTRTRFCLNSDGSETALDRCIGTSVQQSPCNDNVSCPDDCSLDSVACSGIMHSQCTYLLLLTLLLNWLCTQR